MESSKNKSTPKTPFDILFSSTQLDIMKLLLPFMPPSSQGHFAIYIKFQELQETARFFKRYPDGMHTCGFDDVSDTPTDVFSSIKPYLPEENQDIFDNISNMMHMMEMIKQMQALSNVSGDDCSMDFLKHMLSPEQQEMFDAMNQMYDASDENNAVTPDDMKGDNFNE